MEKIITRVTVPCFVHGQDYFLMVEKIIPSPVSPSVDLPQMIQDAVMRGGRKFTAKYLPYVLALMSSGKLPQIASTRVASDGVYLLVDRDPFVSQAPCFVQSPFPRPKRKASKSDIGNIDWQARSFGYGRDSEITIQDIQDLVDQYPGIVFSKACLSDFLESAHYARMLGFKHKGK